MSAETHLFEQLPDVTVRVCHCGKWPDHHVHTGDRSVCGCDDCAEIRVDTHRARRPAEVPPMLERIVIRDRLRWLRS